jgi:hypothetical protein
MTAGAGTVVVMVVVVVLLFFDSTWIVRVVCILTVCVVNKIHRWSFYSSDMIEKKADGAF